MPYVGGKLADLFSEEPLTVAMHEMVAKGSERLLHWAVFYTPIANAAAEAAGMHFHSTEVPGALRRAWKRSPLTLPHREGVLHGLRREVTNDRPYAADVEWGTGLWGPKHARYLIEPKRPGGWLHWIDRRTGKDVFAKRVWHPGSPGAHMLATAVQVTEREVELGLFDEILARWARAQVGEL